MTKTNIVLLAAAGLVLGSAAAVAAPKPAPTPHAQHPSAPAAKLSLQEAQAIALKARPGHVKDHELEQEAGGSGARYSFDIQSGATLFEVGVDANTGQVLENAAEGPDRD